MLLTEDTMISIDARAEKLPRKVIEYNVNMSLSLSNANRSKILQRTQNFFLVLLTIGFCLFYAQVNREIQALELQINSINLNIANVMLKYERLSQNFNRANVAHQSSTKSQNLPEITSSPTTMDYTNNTDHHHVKEVQNSKERFARSIVMFNGQNETFSDDSRTARARRDDGRGPLVATFVGAVPERYITDSVYIGPWVKRNESRFGFNKFHLVEDGRSIEVSVNGLYMISTQIYYFGKPTHYSYWILLRSEGSSYTRKVIKCATVSAASAGEASCYTSVILPLRRGDRLHIEQQERDRLINLREGHSYIQVMLLSNEQQRKRPGDVY